MTPWSPLARPASPSSAFSDAPLDELRNVGDPLADRVIDELFASGDVAAANRILRDLVRGGALPERLPPALAEYLARSAPPADVDRAKLRRAEAVFALHGPSILGVLGFYSLPASYAAKKGVQVLHRTSYLLEDPVRRLSETAQIVVDVLAPGGLDPEGPGVRAAQRTRLVHAAIRHLATRDEAKPWDGSLGLPINQEDMAGTLMTFSFVVLEGLAQIGITLSDGDREAFLYAWGVAGRVLGVDERVIPESFAEAEALTQAIRRRQIAPSREGRALTAALMRGMEELAPSSGAALAGGAIRFFLGQHAVEGEDMAAMLGVPESRLATGFVAAAARSFGAGQRFLGRTAVGRAVLATAARRFVSALLSMDVGKRRAPFTIPESLQAAWQTRAEPRAHRAPRPERSAGGCPFHRALGLTPAAA
jgi:hypothetical protein